MCVQKCKRHRPDGCEGAYERLKCPVCLILPCLMILQKISNHLDLLKGEACTLHGLMHRVARQHRMSGSASCTYTVGCQICVHSPCGATYAVDTDDKAMSEDALRLPRATELARMVLGEDLEALAGGPAPQHGANCYPPWELSVRISVV